MELPHIPSDVPFTGEQKAWLAGFLAGLNTRIAMPAGLAPATTAPAAPQAAEQPEADAPPAGPGKLLILYGTQTGNAEWIADQAKDKAAELGFDVTLTDMGEATTDLLTAAQNLLVVVSTYGEGEMPDDAEDFWLEVAGDSAPRLEDLRYAVCGLGDSIYDGFCQAAKNFDGRLHELGATRVVERVECDVDFQKPADDWIPGALEALTTSPSRSAGM